MTTLIEHARRELESAGLMDQDSDYGGHAARDVLALITLFSTQGHSGGSAGMVSSLFHKLAKFEPLGPLTGADREWKEVGPGVYQNTRCSRVFRTDGVSEDIEGIIWQESSGACYTNKHSRVRVTFPYTPTSVTRPSSEDPGRV